MQLLGAVGENMPNGKFIFSGQYIIVIHSNQKKQQVCGQVLDKYIFGQFLLLNDRNMGNH